MGVILQINNISDNRSRAKEIANKVIKRANAESRKFGDVLQEELKKATKDTDQSNLK